MGLILRSLFTLTFILLLYGAVDAHRQHGMCSWMLYENSNCSRENFLCENKKCIDRSLYCNGVYDCGSSDRSDEDTCSTYNCNNRRNKRVCDDRCIPKEWFCDGIVDCSFDEKSCDGDTKYNRAMVFHAMVRGVRWLYNQSKPESATEIWGSLVEKAAVTLFLTDGRWNNGTSKEIAYETSIQFLSRLYRNKLQDIPSADLASFLNAFLVSCLDPRKFHGINIVEELRNRVDRENFTNPYVLLSLCNAGERITETDKVKLIDTFFNKRRAFWTDMQAVSVMALACADKQADNDVDVETLRELTMELKQLQYRNGTVENLQTTALVLQALYSADPKEDPNNFDERKAIEQIMLSQKPDGSFGNLINTYFVLPILSCKSLVNVSSAHCKTVRKDEMSALIDLSNRSGPKKRVEYSLWIGNEKDLERNLVLRVPQNMSLYGIMEVAAEIDNRYNFEYVVKDRKPYINAISQVQDNPERAKFWFLYLMKDGKPSPSQNSPADVVPADNEHYIMWYRSGSWVD